MIKQLLILTAFALLMCRCNSVSNKLKNNLGNLNGQWVFHNDKQEENWQLEICYNDKSKSGTYVLSKYLDSWGGNNDKVKIISKGPFELIEGHDIYGDKAYVGKNKNDKSSVFAITQIENSISGEWLLRIRIIEDEMFGKQMDKLSNNCD